MVPPPATSASPGILLEMQILGLHPRLADSESGRGVGARQGPGFNKPARLLGILIHAQAREALLKQYGFLSSSELYLHTVKYYVHIILHLENKSNM